MKIFISYAHVDEAQVRELVEILRDDANHDVWFDPKLVAGKAWEDQLLEAIQASDRFLYALTPESVASKWCQWEFAQAVHAGKPVIPVKMQANVTFSGVLDVLNRVQYVDFSKGATRQAAVKLVSGVEKAECISPGDVKLFPAPHAKLERAVEQPQSSSLADEFYREALGLYRGKQYGEAWELLQDCLAVEADHVDGQKLLILVERKLSPPSKEPERPAAGVVPSPNIIRPAASRVLRVEGVLPQPFEWIEIPAGEVILEDASKNGGTRGGKYRVEAFAIAKYPITNAQYQVFVDARDGYIDLQWWSYSVEAKQWREKNKQTKKTAFEGNNLPRTNVCWYEAVAFCQWLSQKTGQQILLPIEQQWQRAAQGDDGRTYPWGYQKPNEQLCNFNRNVVKTTSVSQYPRGASPYGVMDMCGNVWEWCLTGWEVDSIQAASSVARALRGGSWDVSTGIRAAYRGRSIPYLFNYNIGFRCALYAF